MSDSDFPIAFEQDARLRVRQIAEEQNTSVYDVIRTLAEEGALNYFRGRPDDPARTQS